MARLIVGAATAALGCLSIGYALGTPQGVWAGIGLWLILVGVRTLCDRD